MLQQRDGSCHSNVNNFYSFQGLGAAKARLEDLTPIACNPDTRPALVDGDAQGVLGPYDLTWQNGTYEPNMYCEWKVTVSEGVGDNLKNV